MSTWLLIVRVFPNSDSVYHRKVPSNASGQTEDQEAKRLGKANEDEEEGRGEEGGGGGWGIRRRRRRGQE